MYQHAARNRDEKIYRAIDSIFNQSNQNFEIVFVSDGCKKSYDMVCSRYSDSRLRAFIIPKQQYLSGTPRNFGIEKSKGEFIAYLDIDDLWGADHLAIIEGGLYAAGIDNGGHKSLPKWGFFDDWVGNAKLEFRRRYCYYDQQYHCGTSNIVHQRELNIYWGTGYLHDWVFIQQLKKRFGIPANIPVPEYFVCHIPKVLDI